ncbi:MAG: glycosyltransferase, partial [Planctomycetota bacterium]
MSPDLSVVIACYNESDALPHLLPRIETLEAAAAGREVSLEILFVDDGSTDGTREALRDACAGREDRRLMVHV